jgi:hypothetical protein
MKNFECPEEAKVTGCGQCQAQSQCPDCGVEFKSEKDKKKKEKK